MTPQQKLQDDILGILYKNKTDESDESSWIGSEDYHKVADELVSLLLPSEDFEHTISEAASKVWDEGFFNTRIQFVEHALHFATLAASSLKCRVNQLEDAIRVEKTGLAKALESVIKTADAYTWVTQGRGPYAYDDDKYREEVGNLINAIKGIASPALLKAGLDASACLNNPTVEGLFSKEPRWKLVTHHEQGQEDSDFYWEITDGTNSLLSHMDEKEDLQQVVDVLNRVNAELYIDKGAEAAASHVASHFQHELQLLCEKVYAYAHMNKSAGYNGGDDKGREREPECGSIYEIAKSYLPYRHPHEKGLRKKLFPCAFSQCENETELHIDIWGKRQYVCEYHLSSIIDKLESDDTDL